MPDLTPTEWFDQFPPQPQMDGHDQWCGRHWAPCPVLRANGIGAATEVIQAWLTELAPKGRYPAAARNQQLEAAGKSCCALGDDRMYESWGHWPPARPAGTNDG